TYINTSPSPYSTLFRSEPHAVTRAEQAARAIFRARGFELSSDTMMMTQALIGSLPMTLSAPFHADLQRMKRVTTKNSANTVHMRSEEHTSELQSHEKIV